MSDLDLGNFIVIDAVTTAPTVVDGMKVLELGALYTGKQGKKDVLSRFFSPVKILYQDLLDDPNYAWLWSAGFDVTLSEDQGVSYSDLVDLLNDFLKENQIKPTTKVITFDADVTNHILSNIIPGVKLRPAVGIKDYYMIMANRGRAPYVNCLTLKDLTDFFGIHYPELPYLDALTRCEVIKHVYIDIVTSGKV